MEKKLEEHLSKAKQYSHKINHDEGGGYGRGRGRGRGQRWGRGRGRGNHHGGDRPRQYTHFIALPVEDSKVTDNLEDFQTKLIDDYPEDINPGWIMPKVSYPV